MSAETDIGSNIDELEIALVVAGVEEFEHRSLAEDHSNASIRMLSYLKGVILNPNSLFDTVALEVASIVAGVGEDYILTVDSSSITAKHKDTVYLEAGSPGAYVGDIHTGVFIGANGIAMGYNDQTSGNWIDSVAISALGNVSILGTLTAGSLIVGSVTVQGGNALNTIDSNATAGQTHSIVSGSNPHNVPMSTISGDLDDIADGSTYFRQDANQGSGSSRAFLALDSANDYVRSLVTTKITVAGTNPANGAVFDTTGIRGYSGSTLKFNIDTSGDITLGGNLITAGQVVATGVDTGGANGSIVSIPATATVIGLVVIKDINGTTRGIDSVHAGANQEAIRGASTASGGTGVLGLSTSSGGFGLEASNTGSGTALLMTSPIVSGDVDMEDDLNVQGTLDVGGLTTFSGTVAFGTELITKSRVTGHTVQFWTSPGGVDQGSFEYAFS